MAKVSRISSGEVLFEIEDPLTVKTTQLESWSVDLIIQRLDPPASPIRYPGINTTKISIPTLDGGKYKYTIVSKFTSRLNPAITKERAFEGEVTIPEATGPPAGSPAGPPATPGTTFGSTLAVPFDFELELNGNSFPQVFNLKVTSDLVSRLSNAAALKTELTFFLNSKDSITQNITRKFSGPDIDKDPELKQLAGEIIAKTQSLSSDIKGTQDIDLFSNPDNEPLLNELATVILANNVVFPPNTGKPPTSATADPLSDESMKELADELHKENTIYEEADAVEDRTEQIEKEAEKLKNLLDKNKHDMQGLLTVIQTPTDDANAIQLRDVFINQLGHFEKDLDRTIKETEKLMKLRTELTDFEKLKGDIEAETGPTEIKNTEFHENMFKTEKGKKLFRSYTSKINTANDIIAEHNSDIIRIKDEVKKIDLTQVNAQLTRLSGLEKLSGEFKNWIVGFVPNLKKLSKPDEIKTWITNDSVSRLNEVSKDLGEGKTAIIAILSEIKETNKVIKDITRIHKSGKSHQGFNITAWFSRKASKLDSAVSDIKATEVKMRELLSAGTTKPVTTTGTATAPKATATATAKSEVKSEVTIKPILPNKVELPASVVANLAEKGPKTGGPKPTRTSVPTGPKDMIVDLSDHEFYRKLKERTSRLLTDWSLEMVEIYKKGRKFHQRLDFNKTYNMRFMNQTIKNLDTFVKAGKTAINLTQLERDIRGLHSAFTNFREAIGKGTAITVSEKAKFKGLTQRVENDLAKIEELLQEEEKKLAATGTEATTLTREAATA